MPGGRLGVAWRSPGVRLGADKSTSQPSAPVLLPGGAPHPGAEATHPGAEAKPLIFVAGGSDLFDFKRAGELASAPGWVAASDLILKEGRGAGAEGAREQKAPPRSHKQRWFLSRMLRSTSLAAPKTRRCLARRCNRQGQVFQTQPASQPTSQAASQPTRFAN